MTPELYMKYLECVASTAALLVGFAGTVIYLRFIWEQTK